MSERLEISTTQLFDAMDAQLAAQQEAPFIAAQAAEAEAVKRAAAERDKKAAELQRAWNNPTVTAKYKDRDAGRVADLAEVRDVIAQSQANLAQKERRNPSNELEGVGRVETDSVTGIHIRYTKSGPAREYARDTATDPRDYERSGRKARRELKQEVNKAASEKSLTRRIGTLKKELAQAHDNQEDFKARQLEEKLTESREELVVQRALAAERKAAEAARAAKERAASIKRGVKVLTTAEHERTKAEKLDEGNVDPGALAVLNALSGKTSTGSRKPSETQVTIETSPADASGTGEQQEGSATSHAGEQASKEPVLAGVIVNPEPKDDSAETPESVVEPGDGQEDSTRTAGADGDTFHAPASHEALSKFGIRSAVAEKPDPDHGEDAHIVDDKKGLYVVIDGMGGYAHGREAAQAIARGITDDANHIFGEYGKPLDVYQAERDLADMFWGGAGALNEASLSDKDGAAVAALQMVETNEGLQMVYRGAGDALIKVFRAGTVIDINEEQVGPDGTRVTNAIDPSWRSSKDDHGTFPLQEGDRILICSDGITGDKPHEKLTEAEWADAFGQEDPQASADRFIALSKKRDDKTAIVLFVGEEGVAGSGAPEDSGSNDETAPLASDVDDAPWSAPAPQPVAEPAPVPQPVSAPQPIVEPAPVPQPAVAAPKPSRANRGERSPRSPGKTISVGVVGRNRNSRIRALRQTSTLNHNRVEDALVTPSGDTIGVFDSYSRYTGSAGRNDAILARETVVDSIMEGLDSILPNASANDAVQGFMTAFGAAREALEQKGIRKSGVDLATGKILDNPDGSKTLVYGVAGSSLIKILRGDKLIGINSNGDVSNSGIFARETQELASHIDTSASDTIGSIPLMAGDRIVFASTGIVDADGQSMTREQYIRAFNTSTSQQSAQKFHDAGVGKANKSAVVVFVGDENNIVQPISERAHDAKKTSDDRSIGTYVRHEADSEESAEAKKKPSKLRTALGGLAIGVRQNILRRQRLNALRRDVGSIVTARTIQATGVHERSLRGRLGLDDDEEE